MKKDKASPRRSRASSKNARTQRNTSQDALLKSVSLSNLFAPQLLLGLAAPPQNKADVSHKAGAAAPKREECVAPSERKKKKKRQKRFLLRVQNKNASFLAGCGAEVGGSVKVWQEKKGCGAVGRTTTKRIAKHCARARARARSLLSFGSGLRPFLGWCCVQGGGQW